MSRNVAFSLPLSCRVASVTCVLMVPPSYRPCPDLPILSSTLVLQVMEGSRSVYPSNHVAFLTCVMAVRLRPFLSSPGQFSTGVISPPGCFTKVRLSYVTCPLRVNLGAPGGCEGGRGRVPSISPPSRPLIFSQVFRKREAVVFLLYCCIYLSEHSLGTLSHFTFPFFFFVCVFYLFIFQRVYFQCRYAPVFSFHLVD